MALGILLWTVNGVDGTGDAYSGLVNISSYAYLMLILLLGDLIFQRMRSALHWQGRMGRIAAEHDEELDPKERAQWVAEDDAWQANHKAKPNIYEEPVYGRVYTFCHEC
jgi:hypothetical protein